MTEVILTGSADSRVQCPGNCEYNWDTNCWRDGD